MEIRKIAGNYMESSAFPFESMFGTMKNCYCAGTSNIGKQIMANMYRNFKVRKAHSCVRCLVLKASQEDSVRKHRDDFVYNWKDGSYSFYRILKHEDNNDLTVHRMQTYSLLCPTPVIFMEVDTHTASGISPNIECLQASEVHGKAMLVHKYMVTCPKSVFHQALWTVHRVAESVLLNQMLCKEQTKQALESLSINLPIAVIFHSFKHHGHWWGVETGWILKTWISLPFCNIYERFYTALRNWASQWLKMIPRGTWLYCGMMKRLSLSEYLCALF